MAVLTKIDSNVTGLRYAEEVSYKTLPATPKWIPLEPNGYTDFGGQITTVARNPINPSRQRKKGVVTDLDASGGFGTDLTQTNMEDLLQGFFFADLRRKNDVGVGKNPMGSGNAGVNEDYTITDIDSTGDEITVDSRVAVSAVVAAGGTGYAVGNIVQVTDANATVNVQLVVTAVSGGVVTAVALSYNDGTNITYGNEGRTHTDTGSATATTAVTGTGTGLTVTVTYGNGLVWLAGDLILLAGNNDSANNGIKTVASVSDNVIATVENLTTDASPAATATMTTVGHEFDADDLNIVVSGGLPQITSDASFDFSTLGLIPGEFIYIGGDAAGTSFAGSNNNGFARVRSATATAITLDKTEQTMTAESLGGGETIHIYMGRVLKNESDPTLIKRRSYNLERTLGAPNDSQPTQIQAQYIIGSVPNEFSFQVPTAEKVICDLTFVGADDEQRTAVTGVKSGTRPALVEADAFNTSSNFSRIKMAVVDPANAAPTALFAFITDLTLTINNNVKGLKAVGVLGNFEVTAGRFQVGGNLTAYFAEVAAVTAVRHNSDITLDAHMVKANAGISIDIPLITLGDGRPNVEQDEPITLPLELNAATGAKVHSSLDHTLLMVFWDYLPSAAE